MKSLPDPLPYPLLQKHSFSVGRTRRSRTPFACILRFLLARFAAARLSYSIVNNAWFETQSPQHAEEPCNNVLATNLDINYMDNWITYRMAVFGTHKFKPSYDYNNNNKLLSAATPKQLFITSPTAELHQSLKQQHGNHNQCQQEKYFDKLRCFCGAQCARL